MKIVGQHELKVQDFSQSFLGGKASNSQKVFGRSFDSLESMLNIVTLDANTFFPQFLLTFEIFNYNVHNYLIDYGGSLKIIPLNVAKKNYAKWDKIDAQII